MPEISEYGPDLYTLVDEEGKEQTFELLDVMEVEDQVYYALVPYACLLYTSPSPRDS